MNEQSWLAVVCQMKLSFRPLDTHLANVVTEDFGGLVKENSRFLASFQKSLSHSKKLSPLAGEKQCDVGHSTTLPYTT